MHNRNLTSRLAQRAAVALGAAARGVLQLRQTLRERQRGQRAAVALGAVHCLPPAVVAGSGSAARSVR